MHLVYCNYTIKPAKHDAQYEKVMNHHEKVMDELLYYVTKFVKWMKKKKVSISFYLIINVYFKFSIFGSKPFFKLLKHGKKNDWYIDDYVWHGYGT